MNLPLFGADYTVHYLKKDGYLEQSTTGTPTAVTPGYVPATDTSYYDALGRRIAVEQTSQGNTAAVQTTRVFAYDSAGEIVQRRSGSVSSNAFTVFGPASIDHYSYVNGQQVSMVDEGGGIHVLDTLTGFSSGPGTQGYAVQQGDTLASIAQAVYGNSQLSYIVADANGFSSDGDLVVGQSITIPSVTTSGNSATTFKPYDPGRIVGSTTPSLPAAPPPPPSQAGCSGVAQIVMIAVIIVASFYTAGAATGYFEAANAAAATAAGGTAAAVAAAGSAASLTVGESIAIGAIAGAAGSAAGQLAGDALGIHQGFSLGELAVGAAGGAIGGGLSSAFSGTGEFAGTFGSSTGNGINVGGNAIIGAASYAGSYEVGKLTGQATHFSWAGLIESAVGSAVAGKLGPTQEQAHSGDQSGTFWKRVEANAAQDVTERETGVLLGDNHVQSWQQVTEDVFGNALGNGIVVGVNADIAKNKAKQQEESSAFNKSMAHFDEEMHKLGSILAPGNQISLSDSGFPSSPTTVGDAQLRSDTGNFDTLNFDSNPFPSISDSGVASDSVAQQRLAEWMRVVGKPPEFKDPGIMATESDAAFQQDLQDYARSPIPAGMSVDNLPTVEVTGDKYRDTYFNEQTWWAYKNHEPLPAPHSNIAQINAYHQQMYAKIEPAYSKWLVASANATVFSNTETEEEKSAAALAYIYSDPSGLRQKSFEAYSDSYWFERMSIPAAAGAGLAVATTAGAGSLLLSSEAVGGIFGAMGGYISDGWKGAGVGLVVGTFVGAEAEPLSLDVGQFFEGSMLARTGTFMAVNSAAAASGTMSVNLLTGQDPLNNVILSASLGAFIPLASGEAFFIGAGGSEMFGAGVGTGFSLYSGALSIGAASLDPKSEHGLIPRADQHHSGN